MDAFARRSVAEHGGGKAAADLAGAVGHCAGRARRLLLLLLLLSSRQGHHACGDEGRGDVRRIVALVRGLKGRLGGRAGRQPQAAGV